MSAPAAIQAQLVDVRNVAAHKSVRLELHVPAEQAGAVMAAFGWPTMADPVPVALARLNASPALPAKPEEPKERRPFSDLPYAQQAALRCQEPDFRKFLQETDPLGWSNAKAGARFQGDEVAEYVRRNCEVRSRGEVIKGSVAGDRWATLEAQYFAWSRGMR